MVSSTLEWLRGLWRFYLAYTQTAPHAAAAALFAIFALLVFVDPLFAVLAIGSYVTPPIVLYVLEDEPPRHRERSADRTDGSPEEGQPVEEVTRESGRDRRIEDVYGAVQSGDTELRSNGDTDSDSDDGDTDSDTGNGDTDSDSDDGDTDSDSDDGDTDSDSDDGDTDSDSDDGDTDSDS